MLRAVQAFPLWALLFALLAWRQPAMFAGGRDLIVPLLSLVMFGMGLTLTMADFARVARMPVLILCGLLLQYTVMPVSALIIGNLLALEPMLLVGMILVGASPGGTASNVICYLARGNVALSITLTACSTVLAVLLTPLLTEALVDARIDVQGTAMLLSILQMIILPVAAGIALNHFFGRRIAPLQPLFPLLSVAAIVLIIAIIIALNAGRLDQAGIKPLLAVALHNGIGLAAGYGIARLVGFGDAERRTLAIEVGMQNSGLAVALAVKYFSSAAALPGALFSIWHNLSGSLLAAYWSSKLKQP